MDSLHSLPSRDQLAKRPYSTPTVVDLGAVEQLSLAGAAGSAEGPGSKNVKKKL